MSTQSASSQLWELEWTFGDRIRKVRRVLGLTAAQMGETLGMTAQGVSNLEGRPGTPRAAFEIAGRIEEAYEIPAWWLLGHEKAPGPGGPGASARSEGLEPPTFWSGVSDPAEQHSGDVVELFPQHLHEEVAA